ncbi:MAG: LL-diaminopimelate aminotransferase [Candidatus Diapherotrites archaeon]|jgi:LL-diaminopimelate aminotransferase|uniref:LL-diaminopimelate aminotransferase n=1 Tax=Candidatus Iainarchaeum sp. TaxID=3101447 RepID=A0A8T5GEC6_9ARCH|nr:LL-diaminopimelate aminotransferase [Candidatus Diapherotrites archaeon]MBT7241491.1 LL-diaminopimelate aminotransferase [Candidatus Diapherotrites archaeon]
MVKINTNYDKLAAGYLFPEIAKRTKAFLEANPNAEVMKLGIGNTTEPLTKSTLDGLSKGVEKLSTVEEYSGYGDEQGNTALREAIAKKYSNYKVALDSNEVFVSDGAKPDSANIQSIFSKDNIIAVQDPAYPVYVDTNVIAGRTGESKDGQYEGLVYMSCTEENCFFPSPPKEKVDLIYLCSPNNPTGAVATKEQLKAFVDYARENKAIIIFDSAYSEFITDESLPRSIYEIEGAKECAIEINSFSKSAGFTGVRLGWTIVPKALVTEDSDAGKINALWNRRQTTFFNGASNIVQEGGLAVLSEQGQAENKEVINYYMDNAKIIKEGLEAIGVKCFGGVNAPYIWMKTPNNLSSWDFFDKLLNECHVVGTPGSGFGPAGEGYFRLSAFGHRENILKAVEEIKSKLKVEQ